MAGDSKYTGERNIDVDMIRFAGRGELFMNTIPIDASNFSNGENDTGWAIPDNAIILDVFVEVTTAESTGSTKTVDVGTDGSNSDDPDGFLAGVDVSSTGVISGGITVTNGGNEDYISGNTIGALLGQVVNGTNTSGDTGFAFRQHDETSGGDNVTFTPGSNDFAELQANIYVLYVDLTDA